MSGVMLVRQKVADVARWRAVFSDPALDAVRRAHGLVVTGAYVDGEDADTVIVLMDMASIERAREFAGSRDLASARNRAGAIGLPDGLWYGPTRIG
jgi:hypothetical protein